MKKMFAKLGPVATALLLIAGIVVAGTSTITVLDSTGATQTYDVVTKASGHFIGQGTIWDYSAGANGAGVDTSHNLQTIGSVTTGAGASSIVACDHSVVYDASTSGTTKIIALSGTKVTYICGYTIFSAGTVNVNLEYGTKMTNECDTGETKITPAYQLTAQTGAVDGATTYRGLSSAAGKDTCLKTSGGVAVQAVVYYTQI